jgi:hypothetical protein
VAAAFQLLHISELIALWSPNITYLHARIMFAQTDSTTGTVQSVMRGHVGEVISVVLLHRMYSGAHSTTAKCAARAAVRYIVFTSQTTAYSKTDTSKYICTCFHLYSLRVLLTDSIQTAALVMAQ